METVGRPRELAVVRTQKKKMPKKETEIHRQMRAAYLSMGRNRSYRAVGERFGFSLDWVAGTARAFGWAEDARLRDSAIQNEFMEEHRTEVYGAQKLLFESILSDIKREAGIRGIRLGENGEMEKMDGVEVKRFLKETGVGIVVKDYKGMNDLLNALRKVVFEFDPTTGSTDGSKGDGGPLSGARIGGDLNVQLIIEK